MFGLFKKPTNFDLARKGAITREEFLNAEYGEGFAKQLEESDKKADRIYYRARTDPSVADKIQMDIDVLIKERDMYRDMVRPETRRKEALLDLVRHEDAAFADEISKPGGELDKAYEEGVKSATSAAEIYADANELGVAAGYGNPDAQNTIGEMYYYGRGFTQNFEQAYRWIRKAAEHGFPPAQSNLGSMYFNGDGVEQDKAQAVHWWRMAAAQGNEDAKESLEVHAGDGQALSG